MKDFLKKNYFWFIIGFFAVCYIASMAVFTFYDYEVTSSLYNPGTPYGMTFEVLGPILMPFVGIYSIVSIVMNVKFSKKFVKIIIYFLFGLLYVYYFFIGSFTCKYSYLPALFIPAIISYVLWTIGSIFINKHIKAKNLTEIHIKVAWIMFITVLFAMVGSDAIKLTFGRIRFLQLTDKSEFLPWYVIQSHEFNSSFPSGHASRSAIILTLPLILRYFGIKNRPLNILLYFLCFAFIIAVCISRLYEGMHYPTDLLTGFALTTFAFFIAKHKILKD